MTDTTETDSVLDRLAWLTAAFQDPSGLTEADIVAAYDVEGVWRDWSPARELEFLAGGPHAGSRPLVVERITRGEENDATAILVGADGKRHSLTCWSELEPPHRIVGARIVPAPPDGMTIRLATPADGAALAELERRAPIRLGTDPLTLMTFDHGADYFAPSRLMEEVTVYVAEYEGRLVGVYCGAVQPVFVEGEDKQLFLEHHVRIDPEAPRGGVFWALCAYGRDRYARSTDSIAFYVSVDNHAVRKIGNLDPGWSVPPLRALLPCGPGSAGGDVRRATADDAPAIVAAINGAHEGSALFKPYNVESLTERLTRDPEQYTWSDLRIRGGAILGVQRGVLGVTKECEGEVSVARRALVLDHGFVPGAEDDYRALLLSTCAELAAEGATHLTVFTSAPSSTHAVVADIAAEIEEFGFWAFEIPEPPALRAKGFYVDPIYF
jgi:hypothetical protein